MSAPAPLRLRWVSEIPTPYRRPFFRRVAEEPDLELGVSYLAAGQRDRAWSFAEPPAPYEEVLRGLSWCADRRRGYYNRLNPGLLRRLSPRRCDVALFGAYYVASLWLGMYWCRLRGIPYVLQCESHGRRRRRGWRVAAKNLLVGPLIRGAAAWLPLGSLAREYLVGYGADPARCWLCPNTPDVQALGAAVAGLPRREALRRRLGLPATATLFLYVGRLVRIKRVDLLLAAYRQLRRERADVGLVIAGDGPEEAFLRQAAADYEIPEVHFLGFRQPAELPALYAAADALVLPSEDEPWGVVVNEALACGTRVIATDRVGAAPDLLAEEACGLVVPAGEREALAAALARVAAEGRDEAAADRRRATAAAWGYERCLRNTRAAVGAAAGRPPA
jgi:glycosyltransferase involved in cell wall biosynthesis